VTHWIGAAWREGKGYFRGVIDKTAPDLKRWIRAGRVTAPSIFTRPTLRGKEVIDLEPLSIDWAPLDRAGMSTARVVAWGEQTTTGGTTDMELSQLCADVGLPSDASEQTYRQRVHGLYQRAQTSLLADVRAAAGRKGVSDQLQPLVGRLASGNLEPTATPQQIDAAVGEILNSEEYRAVLPGRVSFGTSINPAVANPHHGGNTMGEIFTLKPYRIGP
jgi:hypothetical protein